MKIFIEFALRRLKGPHVQSDLFRLGEAGHTDVQLAIEALEGLPAMAECFDKMASALKEYEHARKYIQDYEHLPEASDECATAGEEGDNALCTALSALREYEATLAGE